MQKIQYSLFLAFSLFILSCEQNPLKGMPEELQTGVLKKGDEHLPPFEIAIYEKLIRVNVDGTDSSVLEFTEDMEKSYFIHIQLLHGLKSKYKVELKQMSFLLLEGAKWSFDTETNRGILTWRPSKTFAEDKTYKIISLSLPVELRDLYSPTKEPLFVIQKKIDVIVYKSLDKPEIYRIKAAHKTYEKLDDGYFYTNHNAQLLDLKHYDRLFLGKDIQQEISTFDHLKFYDQNIYNNFIDSEENILINTIRQIETSEKTHFDAFQVHDKFHTPVPDELLRFIKQPLYYEKNIVPSKEDCDTNITIFKNTNEYLCMDKVTDQAFSFEQNIYIKYYQIPNTIHSKDLFYKIQSRNLCRLYSTINRKDIIKNNKEPEICYLPVSKISKEDEITENENLYLSQHNEFRSVDQSKWNFDFYKIPKHIKWQLSGHHPIKDNALNITLNKVSVGYNHIKIYIKDYNYPEGGPVLAYHQEENSSPFWLAPILLTPSFNRAKLIKHNTWELDYFLKIPEKNPSFNQFKLDLKPVSHLMDGSPVSFVFNIPPSIKTRYVEYFDPEENVNLSINEESSQGVKKWLSSTLSISNQIKAQYIFPSDFVSEVRKFILPDALLGKHFDGKENISDYAKIKVNPSSNYVCTISAVSLDELFRNNYCECLDFIEKTIKDDQIFLERTCSYQVHLHLNAQNLANEKGRIYSAYWHYDYLIHNNKILLDNTFYTRNTTVDIELDLKKEGFFPYHDLPTKKLTIDGNRVHIFFNLIPNVLDCTAGAQDSNNKKCIIIQYPVNLNSNIEEVESQTVEGKPSFKNDKLKLNTDEHFFSERGVQAQSSCSSTGPESEQTEKCLCESPVFFENGIEIKCLLKKDQNMISTYLKTDNPYIYFLNIDPKHNEELKNYKSTPMKTFTID